MPNNRRETIRASSVEGVELHFSVPAGLVVATPLVDTLLVSGDAQAVFSKDQPAEVRSELLASYQVGEWLRGELDAGRVSADLEAAARRQVRRGQEHLGLLLSGAERYIAWVARDEATKRCGEEWARQMVPDLLAEGLLVALECARCFDPTRVDEFRFFLSHQLRHRFVDLIEGSRQSAAGMPDSVASMVRLARGSVLPRLHQQLGRPPSSEELSKALITARLEQALRTSDVDPEQATEAELEAAMARLRRSGYLAAATNGLPEVLAALEGDLSLDGGGEGGRLTLGEHLASSSDTEASALGSDVLEDLLAVSLCGLDQKSAAMITQHWEARMDGGAAVSWRSTATELGVAWTELRDLVAAAEARIGAPHAQYCILAAGLVNQFEAPVADAAPALAALKRRLPAPA